MLDSGANVRLAVIPLAAEHRPIRYLESENRVIGCFEASAYHVKLEGANGWTVFIDDAPLTPVRGTSNAWHWMPSFYAGEVLLEAADAEGALCLKCRIDVSPSSNKLGRDLFQAITEEVFAFSPALLFGEEAALGQMGPDGTFTNVHLAYARLKAFAPGFLAALNRIRRQPQQRLRHERLWRPLHQVRRVDVSTLLAASRDPQAAPVLLSRKTDSVALELPLFEVPAAQHTYDIPGNWAILAMSQAVLRRSRAVTERLKEKARLGVPNGDSNSIEARLPRRIAVLEALSAQIARTLDRTPFSHIRRAEISAAGLNTVAAHPLYAHAYGLGWRALRPGIAGERGEEQLWMSPTWEVYERWAFVQLVGALRAMFPNSIENLRYPSTRHDNIRFELGHDDLRITACLQPRFPAGDQKSSQGFLSISGERYPDLVLTAERAGAQVFLVFDAKYRVSRAAVLDSMASAHLYRDALRFNGSPPDLSLLLVPAAGGAPWLEEAEFIDKQRVGVVCLLQPSPAEVFQRQVEAALKLLAHKSAS